MFLTFWGKPRWIESEHIQHAVHHGHDEPDEANPAAQEDSGHDVTHAVPDPEHGDGTGGYHPHESPCDHADSAGRASHRRDFRRSDLPRRLP